MRRHHREAYEDVVLRTRPAMYVPMQGSRAREVIRQVAPSTETATGQYRGPFMGAVGRRFSASTTDNDKIEFTSNAAYHPGNTFSIGGWFNRIGAGDGANAPTMFHNGTNDFIVYFPLTGNTDKLTLRKAGVGDIFATNRTFASPYADGWVHAIFTKNAGTATVCYINGVSVAGTFTDQTVVASSSAPTFGLISGSTTNDFDGALSHWAIWSRVLTAAEVTELYRAAVE
jgi:hypothetical protein